MPRVLPILALSAASVLGIATVAVAAPTDHVLRVQLAAPAGYTGASLAGYHVEALGLNADGSTRIGSDAYVDEVTDASGGVSFPGLADGVWAVDVYGNAPGSPLVGGLLRGGVLVDLPIDDGNFGPGQAIPAGGTTLTATLRIGGVISGTVRDAGGHGVAGARIDGILDGGGLSGPLDEGTPQDPTPVTAADGTWTATGVYPGDHYMWVSAPSGSDLIDGAWEGPGQPVGTDVGAPPLTTAVGDHRIGIDAVLPTGGSVSGRIVDGSGAGLSGVVVDVGPQNCDAGGGCPATSREILTGSDGSFVVRGLDTGTYGIYVHGSPTSPYVTTGSVTADRTVSNDYQASHLLLDVTRTSAIAGIEVAESLHGAVSGTVGPTGAFASVSLSPVTGGMLSGGGYYGYNDADGNYLISGVPAGTYALSVSSQDGVAAATSVTVADLTTTRHDIVLQQGATLSGQVTVAGQPATGGNLNVMRQPPSSGGSASGFVGASGTYAIRHLLAGDYLMSGQVPGAVAPNQTVTVGSGDTTHDLDLTRGQRLAVTVLDLGGNPVRNANVSCNGFSAGVSANGYATTAADGVAVIDTLPAALSVTCSAQADGYASASDTITTDSDDGVTQHLSLQVQTGASGTVVVTSAGQPLRGQNISISDGTSSTGGTTDASGTATYRGLHAGHVSVTPAPYFLDGFAGAQHAEADVVAGTNPVIHLDLDATRSISGRIHTGASPGGAFVTLQYGNTPNQASALLGSDGSFTYPYLKDGDYTLVVNPSVGGTIRTFPVSIDAGHLTESIDVDLSTGVTPTTTALAFDHSTAGWGAPVIATATVVASDASPTSGGEVSFTVDGQGFAALVPVSSDGTAAFTLPTLEVGTHSVVAQYSGTADLAASTKVASVTVTPLRASVTADAPSSVAYGSGIPVSLGATSGAFTFSDGSYTIDFGSYHATFQQTPTSGSVVTIPASAYSATGSSTLTVTLADGSHYTGASTAKTITVTGAPAQITSSDLTNPRGAGSNPATVSVSGAQVAAGDQVTVRGGDGTLWGTAVLGVPNGGIATGPIVWTSFPASAGDSSVTVTYAGNARSAATHSDGVMHAVERVALGVVSPAAFSASGVFVTAAATGGATADGRICGTLDDQTTPACADVARDGARVGGRLAVAASVGAHTLHVVYTPTGSFLATTADLSFSVAALAPTVALELGGTSGPRFGDDVSATVTVTGETGGAAPSGTATIVDGGGHTWAIGPVTSAADPVSTAHLVVHGLPGGTTQLHAEFAPTAGSSYASASSSETAVVLAPAATAGSISVTSGDARTGSTLAGTVLLTGPGALPVGEGSVTILVGSRTAGSATWDAATGLWRFSVPVTEAPGDYSLTAAYHGTASHADATAAGSLTVLKAAAGLALTLDQTTVTVGASVTVHVTSSILASRQVTVAWSGSGSGSVVVQLDGAGTGDATIPADNAGQYTVTATFGGDPTVDAGSVQAAFTVAKKGARIAVDPTDSAIVYGTAEPTVTPSFAGLAGGDPAPTGTVTVTIDGGAPQTEPASAVGTVLEFPAQAHAGTHTIVVAYSGDDTYAASEATSTLTVTKAAPVITIAAPDPALTAGTAGTSTIHVPVATASAAIDGGTPTAVTVSGGTAHLAIPSTLSAGLHTITVTTAATADYLAGSGSVSFAVGKAASSITTPAGSSVSYGDTVTLTATVAGPVAPTGTVQLREGDAVLGSASVSGGHVAVAAGAPLHAGTHQLVLVYGGDGNLTGATSGTVTIDVTARTSSVGLALSTSVAGDRLGTLTATVSAGSAPAAALGGTVRFTDGSTLLADVPLGADGTATWSIPLDLAAGDHSFSAQYVGTTDVGGSTAGAAVPFHVSRDEAPGPEAAFPTEVHAGGTTTFTISGFTEGDLVDVVLFSTPYPLGTFRAGPGGVVTVTFTVPAGIVPGQHHLEVRGPGGVRTFVFTVDPAAAASRPLLAATGVDPTGGITGALALFLLGALLMSVRGAMRRRDRRS